MKILKKKSSDYNKLTNRAILNYCREYAADITSILETLDTGESINKTALKTTAAELETIRKRLRYYVYGEY